MPFLSKRIIEEIDKRGLKRRFVAKKLGLTENRFYLMVSGRLQVRADEMLRLADFFDLEPEEVISREEAQV